MNQHTPGPWNVVADYSTFLSICGRPGQRIARVNGTPHGEFDQSTRITDEASANARLIAKAPEMRDVIIAYLATHEPLMNPPCLCQLCLDSRALLGFVGTWRYAP